MKRCRRPIGIVAIAAATGVAACGGDAPAPDEATVDVAGDCEADTIDALGAWGDAGFNGVVVVDGAEGRCGLGVGRLDGEQVTSDSVFAIGSVSKAFTAAAVLQLEATGALDLDEPAGAYVEGLTGPAAAATIESLVFHTSGLVGSHGEDSEPLSKQAAVEAISALTVDETARGTFLYSNTGYTVLAMVIEGASGIDYRRYMSEHVLPAEGRFWHEDDGRGQWATEGNGDLAMSSNVLADWTGDVFDGAVVPPGSLDLVLEPTVDDDGTGITAGWGRLSADLFGEPVVATAGGGGDTGHNVVTAWLPESKRTVVVASSTDAVTAETLLQAIGSAVVAEDSWPRPDDTAEVDAELLESSAGTYTLTTGGRYEVVAAEDRLVVDPVGADALAAIGQHADVADDEVASHEERVLRMLAGETEPGRAERALLEEDFGPLGEVRLLGSMVEDGELRTYVELSFAKGGTEAGWYALNTSGGIEGVDLAGPPYVGLIPTSRGFRVDGQPLGGQAVIVTFDDEAMTIAGTGQHRRRRPGLTVRVLVVEDDPVLGPLIARGLRRHHHAVDVAPTFQAATEAAATTDYDLVCLDLGLPDGDGLDLARRLRTGDGLRQPRRILAVTARDAVSSRIAGLDAGADDYLVKPFDFDELVARVRALDRRAGDSGVVLRADDLRIDLASHGAERAGRALELTSRELAVLVHLVKRRGAVVSAEELLEHCWDSNADPFTSSVRVIVSRLRRKLGDPPLIDTVARSGYRVAAPS